MARRMYVKPRAGRKVPDLAGGYLAEAGGEVEFSAYWQRRLRDKDVVLMREAEIEALATPPTPKAEKPGQGKAGALKEPETPDKSDKSSGAGKTGKAASKAKGRKKS